MLRLALEPSFILHRRPWRETSELLECLTRAYGRVGVLQRGARGASQAKRGRAQAFTPVLLSGAGREDGLLTAHALEATSAALVRRDVGLACGFYLNELLLALLPRLDPCPELFDAYAACLAALSEERSPAGWLRWFEYRLLRQLGEITSWQFSNESGLQASYVLDDDGQWLESTLHHAVRGELIGSIARGDCDAIEQVKQKPLQDIFRSRLEHLLGGRRLHSRDMLEVYRTKRSSRHKGGAG